MVKPSSSFVTIDGRDVPIEGERNLLELIRKSGIDLPTFCYHSDLSIYGACRLCLVEVENRGIMGACSTPPEPGMKVRTQTEEIREIRKITGELLLANHIQSCPTCSKASNCGLQKLAWQLGIDKVRFKPVRSLVPVDVSSPSLVRDPNKCVLCGDCVRVCSEIQGVGAIDFIYRGHQAAVAPAFGKNLGDVECVNCGQCVSVCPTGALTVKSEVDEVWNALHDPEKRVVAQIAPAVRVGLGECFGMEPGSLTSARIVSALKMLGFDDVYDTAFAADLTVIEEATEFLKRKSAGERLPQFTSCCPAWVKYAEFHFPEILPNLSTCRSPQQMFGSLVKALLPEKLGIDRSKLHIVSIMPCTAKKFEARREEFQSDGIPDVDNVLSTQELARMIESAGIRFGELAPGSFDMPFGFATGAGVIFGNSGGVTEAVLRYATEKAAGRVLPKIEFQEVRGASGLREARIPLDGGELKLAVVYGLKNASMVVDRILKGKASYDLVEIMACPGGCVGGAGQPVPQSPGTVQRRTEGLYQADLKLEPLLMVQKDEGSSSEGLFPAARVLQRHKSQNNIYVLECYDKFLGEIGGDKAHQLLHTHYQNRRRISDESFSLLDHGNGKRVLVNVCLGTNCYVKGSQALLHSLILHMEEQELGNIAEVRASFCLEKCGTGPNVMVDDILISEATPEKVLAVLEREVEKKINNLSMKA